MVTTMFGLSPIGPSLVPRLHGIETNESESRESNPSRAGASSTPSVTSRRLPVAASRERRHPARLAARTASSSHAVRPETRVRRYDVGKACSPTSDVAESAAGAVLTRTPLEVSARDGIPSLVGCTSGVMPEKRGALLFENIFTKNNDLRNLTFRGRRSRYLHHRAVSPRHARRGSNPLYGAERG